MFLKLNFHLPLSCFDLDLQEDMSLLLPGFHHSVIILYTMKDNLRGELHFSLAPLAAAPRHYLANPKKKRKKKKKLTKDVTMRPLHTFIPRTPLIIIIIPLLSNCSR